MKKQKLFIKILLVLVITTLFALLSNGIFAANTPSGVVTLSEGVDANKLTITRYVKDVASNVTNTFTYTIEADESNPETVTGYPTTATVVFNSKAPVNNIATETGVLDMAGATFTKLGDYKFKVTETNSTNATKYPLDPTEYYIYVSVRNELDTNNQPTGNFIATLVAKGKKDDTGEKTDLVYESSVPKTNIEISKTVTGAMADINKYFKFNLNIAGLAGETYGITGDHSVDGENTVDTSTYTVGTTSYIYLKHGQSITINNIPEGTKYTITEQDATDYKTYIDGSTTDNKAAGEKTITADNTDDNTSFVNNKEEEVLTGVFLNIAPFIGLVLLSILGLLLMKKTSKK